MSVKFIAADQGLQYLFPPSVQDWLPERHLARFVVEIVEQLDLRSLKESYTCSGNRPYHPAMLVALLFYGYATGVFSSRKLERATYDSVAFRFIAVNSHPDHDTIATFRKRFLPQLSVMFVEILTIAQQMGLLKLGKVSLDGTKIHANASKHKALSYGHATKLQTQLEAEVAELLALAEAVDRSDIPDGMDIPNELASRQDRIQAIKDAKIEIERRAAKRYDKDREEYEHKLAERTKKEHETGKKPRGKQPKPPTAGPRPKDQVNLTDADSRIMPTSGGGFDQSYNAQAGVDTETMLIVCNHLSQATNDKQELKPAVDSLKQLPAKLGAVTALLADTGYFSATNVNLCVGQEVTPYIAVKREGHHPSVMAHSEEPPPLTDTADATAIMKHRLKTKAGRAVYATRKATIEPVFGIIKAVMGFRQFLLRGKDAVKGEWNLVCIAFNLKRLFVLAE